MRNKEHYNNRMNIYMKNRYNERRKFAIDKLGGKCCKCGSVDNLEFDHIDKKFKTFSISKLWSISFDNYLKELDKCQLLCTTCHKEKSALNYDLKPPTEHGKITMYKKYGCRCELCITGYKESCKIYSQRYRQKKLLLSIAA